MLSRIDDLHHAIRGNSSLSHRIAKGSVLTKAELRELLSEAPEGHRRWEVDGIWRAPAANVTDREIDLLFEVCECSECCRRADESFVRFM